MLINLKYIYVVLVNELSFRRLRLSGLKGDASNCKVNDFLQHSKIFNSFSSNIFLLLENLKSQPASAIIKYKFSYNV